MLSNLQHSYCPFLDALHCLPCAVEVSRESAFNLVSRKGPREICATHFVVLGIRLRALFVMIEPMTRSSSIHSGTYYTLETTQSTAHSAAISPPSRTRWFDFADFAFASVPSQSLVWSTATQLTNEPKNTKNLCSRTSNDLRGKGVSAPCGGHLPVSQGGRTHSWESPISFLTLSPFKYPEVSWSASDVAGYIDPLLFLFDRTYKYYVDNQGLVPWRLRRLGGFKVR